MPNGEHFFTADAAERDRAIRDTTFESEGIACYVLPGSPSGLSPLYRAYNGGHFYTTNFAERNTALGNDYSPEGITAYVHSGPGPGLVAVHRLVNQQGRHFYTTNAAEATNASQHLGYRSEGTPFYVYSAQQPGTTPLYRLYLGKNDDHFYTTGAAERNNAIQKLGFANEGSIGYVHASDPAGVEALYRMRSDNGHFYTSSLDEYDKVAKQGWVRENIACYVYSAAGANRTALYRLYRSDTGDHFYTINPNERDNAVAHLKYLYEGVAGYVAAGPLPGTIPFYRLLMTDVSSHKLPFVPVRDGFAFTNNWKWDPVDRQKVQDILRTMVPAAMAALSPLLIPAFGVVDLLGLLVGIPPGTAEIATLVAALSGGLGKIVDGTLKDGFGLCGGMAFASLDYYQKGWVVNRGYAGNGFEHTSPEASALRNHIWSRLVDSFTSGGVALQTLEWMGLLHFIPESCGGGDKGLRDRTHASWDQLKRVIKSGTPCPIALIGTTSDPSHNHQILAYGYEDQGNGKGRIYVYDNNAPDVESTIDLDFNASPLGSKESCASKDRGPLRGFFLSHYTPMAPPLAVGLSKNIAHANQQLTIEVANIGLGPTPLLDITAVAIDRSTRRDLKPPANPLAISSRVTADGKPTNQQTTRTFTIPVPADITPDTWTIEVEARVSQQGVAEEVRQLPATTAGVLVMAAMHLP